MNPNLIWTVAEILRGDFKQSEYQTVVRGAAGLRVGFGSFDVSEVGPALDVTGPLV
jgi:hypothetical protein